jgi:methylase of polypeptide subunit release factors
MTECSIQTRCFGNDGLLLTLTEWRYKTLTVYYRPDLNGGGTELAGPIVEFLKHQYPQQVFGTIFEWCCGPAFIGFAVLAEGIGQRLCLADINPDALACVETTVTANNLQDKVSYYVSDNFNAIPDQERFDLVVSNPPNFFAINPEHPLSPHFKDDLRPNDPGWNIHRDFYRHVSKYLQPGAQICISEVEPDKSEVYVAPFTKKPYERRPEPPIHTFKRMIAEGGLTYLDTKPYAILGNLQFFMVMSRYQ